MNYVRIADPEAGEVSAVQFLGWISPIDGDTIFPYWFCQALAEGRITPVREDMPLGVATYNHVHDKLIRTNEGQYGDYIVRYPDGAIVLMTASYFTKNYVVSETTCQHLQNTQETT
jgi:hypothetical protein